MWRDKSSQGKRGIFGEKGETISRKPVICDLPEKKGEECCSKTWSRLREQTCEIPRKALKVDTEYAWQLTPSHLICIPTLKGRYYYLNFTGKGVVAQRIEMTNKRQNAEFDCTFSDSNRSSHVLPSPSFHRVPFIINKVLAGVKSQPVAVRPRV